MSGCVWKCPLSYFVTALFARFRYCNSTLQIFFILSNKKTYNLLYLLYSISANKSLQKQEIVCHAYFTTETILLASFFGSLDIIFRITRYCSGATISHCKKCWNLKTLFNPERKPLWITVLSGLFVVPALPFMPALFTLIMDNSSCFFWISIVSLPLFCLKPILIPSQTAHT